MPSSGRRARNGGRSAATSEYGGDEIRTSVVVLVLVEIVLGEVVVIVVVLVELIVLDVRFDDLVLGVVVVLELVLVALLRRRRSGDSLRRRS